MTHLVHSADNRFSVKCSAAPKGRRFGESGDATLKFLSGRRFQWALAECPHMKRNHPSATWASISQPALIGGLRTRGPTAHENASKQNATK
jgi:hypothetical protein